MALFSKKVKSIEPAEKKAETRIILFTGAENGLVPYHAAKLLLAANPGTDILLIDNSIGQDLFDPVPHTEEIGNADEIYVLANRSYTEEAFRKFDYVFVYSGLRAPGEYLQHADRVFVLCDYTPKNIDRIAMLPLIKRDDPAYISMLFLDKATGKIQEKSVLQKLPYAAKGMTCLISGLTLEDKGGYIAFLHNGRQQLSSMSGDWKDMMAEVCTIIRENNSYKKAAKSV